MTAISAQRPTTDTASTWRVLREEPRFSRLLLGTFISGVGNWFNTTAVLSLLLTLTGSGLAVGMTLALRTIPGLFVGPLAGVVADRLPRKTILIVTDITNAGVALVFLLVTSPGRIWIVYVGMVSLVVVGMMRSPARSAVVRGLVRPEHLLVATALEGTVSGSVMIIGAVLGGVVSGAFGVRVAFVVNSISFVLSALLTLTIRFPAMSQSIGQARRRLLGAWAEAWPIVRGSRVIQIVLLMVVLWPIGGGMLNTLISVYAFQVFHAGAVGVGVLYGAIGAGILCGGLLAARLGRRLRMAYAGAFVVEGIFQALAPHMPWLALGALVMALATVGAGLGNAGTSYLLMRATPEHALGRIFALIDVLSATTFAASMLVGGLLLATIPAATLGSVAGALIALVGVVAGALLWRTPLPAPESPTAEVVGDEAIKATTEAAEPLEVVACG